MYELHKHNIDLKLSKSNLWPKIPYGNVMTRRCLGITSAALVIFYFFIWVLFIWVCLLCNNSLSCSVYYNLIMFFTKETSDRTKIDECSLAITNSFYQYFRSRKKSWKFMKEIRSSKCMLQNICDRNWFYFKQSIV